MDRPFVRGDDREVESWGSDPMPRIDCCVPKAYGMTHELSHAEGVFCFGC